MSGGRASALAMNSARVDETIETSGLPEADDLAWAKRERFYHPLKRRVGSI